MDVQPEQWESYALGCVLNLPKTGMARALRLNVMQLHNAPALHFGQATHAFLCISQSSWILCILVCGGLARQGELLFEK